MLMRTAVSTAALAAAIGTAQAGAPMGLLSTHSQPHHLQLVPTVGYVFHSRYVLGDGSGSSAYNQTHHGRPTLVAGLGVTYVPDLNRVNGFTMQLGLLYEYNRYFRTTSLYGDPRTVQQNRSTVALDYIVLPALGRYSFGQASNVRPYVELGPTFRLIAKKRENEDYALFVGGVESRTPYLDHFNPIMLGGAVGAGVELGAVSGHYLMVGVRAELATGPASVAGGAGHTTALSANLGYTLTK